MFARLRPVLPAVLALAVFIVGLEVLRAELRSVTWVELTRDVVRTPPRQLAAAVMLTVLGYAVLTGYDFLAFAYIGRRLKPARIALTSFLAYAIANSVGGAALSGASIRYRFYTRWGVTAQELARIIFSYSVTFWIGLLLLGGLSLASTQPPSTLDIPLHGLWGPLGWLLMTCSFTYVVATFIRRDPVRLGPLELPLPRPHLAIAQLVVSGLDWALAAAVLYTLLPSSNLSFLSFVGAFLAAQLLGLASHVPGGVGVFEGLMVLLLKPELTAGQLLPALVVYRGVYYLLPLTVALLVLVADELYLRRTQAARAGAALGRLTEQLAPRLLAAFTFLSGAVLLFSGATPAAAGRLALLDRVLPLGVIETSHFLGSLVGAALLLLSQGLARRLDAAYFFSVVAIVTGIAASLLKGADYEEATLLVVLLLALWWARRAFDRRAALFDTRFSASWIVSIVGVVAASIWLGLFAFKHVEYSNDLWWQFELRGEASRFLRATVGAAVALALFGFARLMSFAPHETVAPDDADLDTATGIIAAQTSTLPFLVYLRDKAVLFDDERTGFVMYGVQGHTWVALGDPVGPLERFSDLVRKFLERCLDFGGVPVFYEVRKDQLYRYADFGLSFVKLGEDANVDLRRFTLEGNHARKHRQALHRLDREGATFRVVPRNEQSRMIDQLRDISDDWLRQKASAEKGFSLGSFDPEYLSRFPIGVIEQRGHPVAFANLWLGPQKHELSLDLMRYRHDAPKEVMEGLFIHVMKWGKAEGYEHLSLGMAPLSGFERSPIAPLWNRVGSFVYKHGELFYNFQGLRAYKEKFDPEWESRYLVYPSGLRLPRILADVAALVAGGYRRILLN